jgi:hypothetical protein
MGRRVVYIKPQGGYLPLTTAWITQTGETDLTIINALNTREQGWITNGLTSKITAQYPMVGGGATKHSYNFMNTALYQLTFTGGWTHSSNGALPNGTNAYASTGLNANSVLTQNDNHIGFYSRTNAAMANRTAIGCYVSGTNALALNLENSIGDANGVNANTTAGQFPNVANSDSSGFYISSKTSSAIGGLVLYKNGSSIAANTIAVATNSYPNTNVLISALTTGLQFDNKQCAGVYIGKGLTAGEVATLYTLEQAFQTALSRQV